MTKEELVMVRQLARQIQLLAGRELKRINQAASVAKAKTNGTKMGRPRNIDWSKIRKFRSQGFSIRQIAKLVGCSSTGVQRALNEAVE